MAGKAGGVCKNVDGWMIIVVVICGCILYL